MISAQQFSILVLGVTQICIGSLTNLMVILFAAAIAGWFAKNPLWLKVQRYVMGFVLGALAFKLITQQRQAA